mgnify:CR=1 FL=1
MNICLSVPLLKLPANTAILLTHQNLKPQRTKDTKMITRAGRQQVKEWAPS